PVDEPADAPEALGLALRDETVLRRVQAFELGVLLRHDARHGFQREGIRHVTQRELLRRDLVLRLFSVERDGNQLQLLSVEHERTWAAIAPHLQPRAHSRVVVAHVDIEIERVDPELSRRVILEVNRSRLGFSHLRKLVAAKFDRTIKPTSSLLPGVRGRTSIVTQSLTVY